MKMKKVSKSRWAMLVFVLVCLFVIFNVAGCSMLQNPFNAWGEDKIEVPVCEGEACEDIRG
tara:strand:- start:5255 stop:5437 length:183 start_codon:yes stop_codon:yes gene_type:complete